MNNDKSPAVLQYEKDGYIVFKDVLDEDLIAAAGRHVDWLLEQHPGVRPEHLGHLYMIDDPFWLRLVSDPRLLDIVQQFIGPNIVLFASHYISKPPFDGQPVLWHQDGSYWPLEPMEVVTLWLAIDNVTVENGCMRVIPGTQNMELQQLQKRTDVVSVLSSSMDDSLVDESKAVDILLTPGSVEVHHPNVIHGSNANNSPNRRCGLTIRYIPATTRVTDRSHFPKLFLLRGDPVPGINSYDPLPKYVEGKHFPFKESDAWK